MNFCLHLNFIGKDDTILVTVFLNNTQIFNHGLNNSNHIISGVFINSQDLEDQTIKISMHGKNHTHTVVDQQGNIISDHAVTVEKILLDGIDVTELYCTGTKCYTHNNNGLSEEFLDQFYGYIGCNGAVDLAWTTPLNLWFIQKCQ